MAKKEKYIDDDTMKLINEKLNSTGKDKIITPLYDVVNPYTTDSVLLNGKKETSTVNPALSPNPYSSEAVMFNGKNNTTTATTEDRFPNPYSPDAVLFNGKKTNSEYFTTPTPSYTPSNNGNGSSTTETTTETTEKETTVPEASTYIPFDYSAYVPSNSVNSAYNELVNHSATKPSEWNGGAYSEQLQSAIDSIANREKFSYDLNADALYNQYKNQYLNQGKLAMQDAIGQASALTGGYGNSYAASVGNQAYQGYVNKLNDVVPQLYQLAYDKYNQETDDLYNQYNLYKDAYDNEYGEYRNKVSDWQNEEDNLRSAYNTERNFDYNKYNDDYDKALTAHKDKVSQDQYDRDMALSIAKANASSSTTTTSTNSSGSSSSSGYAAEVTKYLAKEGASYDAAVSAIKEDYANGTISQAEYREALGLIQEAYNDGKLK